MLAAAGCGSSSKGRVTKSRNTANPPVASAAVVPPPAASPASPRSVVGSPASRLPPTAASAAPATAAAPAATPGTNDYIIRPTDIIDIAVYQEQDLKSTLRVSNEGTIVFPLIGSVPVGGLSPQGAAQAIRDRLAKGYLVNPQVTVTVMEFSKRRFTVLGEVQKPGSYDMPPQGDVTVLQAIGMAGGYTRIANPGKVTLMRKIDSDPQTFSLDARRMASGRGETAFIVQPGDVITVAESRF